MEVPQRVKLIQLVGEIAIPLLGYFWWNWSFYFLLLFYLLDLLANAVLVYVKAKKINLYTGTKSSNMFGFTIQHTALLLTIIGLGIGYVARLNPGFDFEAESIRFVLLKDMGMPQGIFLIPLVIYSAYLNYKMSFLLPQRFRTTSVKQLHHHYFTALYLVLAALGLGLGISFFYLLPEILNVLLTVLGIGFYSYFYKK